MIQRELLLQDYRQMATLIFTRDSVNMTFNIEKPYQFGRNKDQLGHNPPDSRKSEPKPQTRRDFKRPRPLQIKRLVHRERKSLGESSTGRNTMGDYNFSRKFTDGEKDFSKFDDQSPSGWTPNRLDRPPPKETFYNKNENPSSRPPDTADGIFTKRGNVFENSLISNHLCESLRNNLYLPMSTNTCYNPSIRNLSESMKGIIDQKILDTFGGANRVSANYLLSGINHGF
jgi:hypothetical protein